MQLTTLYILVFIGIFTNFVNTSVTSKCNTCKDIVKKFKEGLVKTAKSGFGGGNTHWEEKSLGSFAFSETRLIEITEGLCDSEKECHSMVEEHEEDLETWWFKHYAKKKDTQLEQFLCVEKVKVCCPSGTYGKECKPCKPDEDRPCKGNGKCDGEGTRAGSGKCRCDLGYSGDLCDACTGKYYEEVKNDTHTVCKACHESCKSGCSEEGPLGCDDCKDGWKEDSDKGCVDVNECEDNNPCTDNQFCTNNEGSFTCINCDSSCKGCTGSGKTECVECANKYFRDEDTNTCRACHDSCANSCTDETEKSCDKCDVGWNEGENGCEDVNECVENIADCDDDEYCVNTIGSSRCATCHHACDGCTGAGSKNCKECKKGYSKDDKGMCKDDDECSRDDSCTGENQRCVNLPGTFRCDCVDGYILQGDTCIQPPKAESEKKKEKSKVYKGPGNCDTCKKIVENFNKGLEKTDRKNFGGGNTKWEEQKLGSYATSETRLTEILEEVCEGASKKSECYDMVEHFEEAIERWWFGDFQKGVDTDLIQWLCVDSMIVCCSNGSYGPECKTCPGGEDNVCNGRGKCDGDGTRKGNGECKCDKSFTGVDCDKCDTLYFEESREENNLVCTACHKSCKTSCHGTGAENCKDCKDGYSYNDDVGCIDVNECESGDVTCEDGKYCSNTQGSYACLKCDKACKTCSGSGPTRCTECADRYFNRTNICLPCHDSCANSCTGIGHTKCDSCKEGWNEIEGQGCVDKNECELGEASCKGDEYCENTPGSYDCKDCDRACMGCRGAGPDKCYVCKDGYGQTDGSKDCTDIDECSDDSTLCDKPHMSCVNIPGMYYCECEEGFVKEDGECVPDEAENKKNDKDEL